MSDARERLKKLLDGELEASDIAEDASLVSLADRLYGIKIANVKPVKARDMQSESSSTDPQEAEQFGQTSSMMVEVIEPTTLPIPELNHLAMPDLPTKKNRFSVLSVIALGGITFVILNIFGLFSTLFESSCAIDSCRSAGQTRMNLMDIYKFSESDGWSYSVLTDGMSGIGGTSGGIGIPDIVALLALIGLLIISRRK
ncbi:MAG TPA: hypothetical protein HA354_04570 [Candidatus Poseidoniaceae archaeon]|nr:hypothetical protein [Euryarchaeota archaeon]DAC57921.1 MAG TPA: hypothetical protein D7I07_04545 [Candidatus Poseidoniales archaeon]HII37752.1 hypothetical protein [Candidatus Poseidoniaceae archaeon]|tara:strand:- start:1113 stop:1709 length:597 start_codon:yes stop_codon:yes gene_type:complete